MKPPWGDGRPGLVLSGGGARGAFQVGVWSRLREDGRGFAGADPWLVCGTSAGAINAALLAVGLSPGEMLDFWLDLAEDPPVTAEREVFRTLFRTLCQLALREPFRSVALRRREFRALKRALPRPGSWTPSGPLAFALEYAFTARFDTISDLLDGMKAPSLFDTRLFRARLAERLGGSTFRPRLRIAVHTIDIATGDVVRWVSHPTNKRAEADQQHYRVVPDFPVDVVAASAAIPILFDPVRVRDPVSGRIQALWDGGVLVNTPMAPVAALEATHAIPVLVTAGGGPAPTTMGQSIERLADVFLENAYAVDRKLLLERNHRVKTGGGKGQGFREITLYEPIRPEASNLFDAGSYLHFEAGELRRMHDAGRVAAQHWLDRGPRIDAL